MFDQYLTSKGNSWSIGRIDDVTSDEQAANGIIQLKLLLKEIGNPGKVGIAHIGFKAELKDSANLRARMNQGRRIYLTLDSSCLTGVDPVPALVTDFQAIFE